MDERDGSGEETAASEGSSRRGTRRAIATAIPVLVAIVVVALISDPAQRADTASTAFASASPPEPSTAPISTGATATSIVIVPRLEPTVIDDFDRDDAAVLGIADSGPSWDAVRGTWAIDHGAAVVSESNGLGALRNLAILDLGSGDGSVAATITGKAICGVVVRYSDPFNFVILKRVSLVGLWSLEQNVAGATQQLTILDDPATDVVDIRLDFAGEELTAYVGGASATVRTGFNREQTLIGMVAERAESTTCRWDSYRAWAGAVDG